MRNFLIFWLPVIVWMCVIFTASGDASSFQRSSRVIGPLVRWLFPGMSEEAVNTCVLVVRKCAHLTEYAILALLVWRARQPGFLGGQPSWHWLLAGEALWVAVLYAATDEFHQTFIPSREGCLRDVFIDSSGAAAGLFLLWAMGRWRRFW